MRIWKVSIDGVGHRYVPARGRRAAVEIIQEQLLRAVPIQVDDTEPHVEEMWRKASNRDERSQQRLLRKLDTFNDLPLDRRDISRARLQAERNLNHLEAMEAHIDQLVADAGPLSPRTIANIQRIISQSLRRDFSEWE